jgi:hypothetical protein
MGLKIIASRFPSKALPAFHENLPIGSKLLGEGEWTQTD